MRKIVLLVAFATGFGLFAQAQVKVGAHLGFSAVKDFGVGVNGEYFLNEKISIAPDFAYFFTTSEPNVKRTSYEINLNGHYYFYEKDKFKSFGLLGLNHSRFSTSSKFESDFITNTLDLSFSKTTLNLGIGITYQVADKIELFSSLKYTMSVFSGGMISAGAKYQF